MSIKDKAKKIGAALIFQKLYSEIKAKKEENPEDFEKLRAHIDEWIAQASNDLNAILASILLKAEDAPAEDIRTEMEDAKAQYSAEDYELTPWFEDQINTILEEKEAEEAAAAEE